MTSLLTLIRIIPGLLLALCISQALAESRPAHAGELLKVLTEKEVELAGARGKATGIAITPANVEKLHGILSDPLQSLGNSRMFAGDIDGALGALDESNLLTLTEN